MTEYDLFPAIRFTYQGDVERAMQCVPHARALMQQLTRRMEAMGRDVGVWNVTTPDGIEMVLQRFGDQVAAAIYAPAVDAGAATEAAEIEAAADGAGAAGLDEPVQRFKRDFREELAPVEGGDLWIGARVVGGSWPSERRRVGYKTVNDSRVGPTPVVIEDSEVEDTIYPGIGLCLFPPGWVADGAEWPHESAFSGSTLFEVDTGTSTVKEGPLIGYDPARNVHQGWGFFYRQYIGEATVLVYTGTNNSFPFPDGYWPGTETVSINKFAYLALPIDPLEYPFSPTIPGIIRAPETSEQKPNDWLGVKYTQSDFGAFSSDPLIYYGDGVTTQVQTYISVSPIKYPKEAADFYEPSADVIRKKLYVDVTEEAGSTEQHPTNIIDSPLNVSVGPPYIVEFGGSLIPFVSPIDVGGYATMTPEPDIDGRYPDFPDEDPYHIIRYQKYTISERHIIDCDISSDNFDRLSPPENYRSGVYELRLSLGWQEWVEAPGMSATVDVIIRIGGNSKTYTVNAPIGEFIASYDQNWRDSGRPSPFEERPDYGEIWYPGYWLIDTETGSIIHETQDLTRPWFNT